VRPFFLARLAYAAATVVCFVILARIVSFSFGHIPGDEFVSGSERMFLRLPEVIWCLVIATVGFVSIRRFFYWRRKALAASSPNTPKEI